MTFRPAWMTFMILLTLLVIGSAAAEPTDSEVAESPMYAEDGSLRRPDGFRNWVFVGASLGLSYSPHKSDDGNELFHNVYLDRQAYDHYAKTGEFPEQSMLAMSVYRQTSKAAGGLPLQGSFEGEFVSLEVAVKDSQRFEDGWAYFDFSGGYSQKDTARSFARDKCFDCHAEHAADDNVFTQYYPMLRRLKTTNQTSTATPSNPTVESR